MRLCGEPSSRSLLSFNVAVSLILSLYISLLFVCFLFDTGLDQGDDQEVVCYGSTLTSVWVFQLVL